MYRLMIKDIYTQRKSAYVAPLLLIAFFITKEKDINSTVLIENLIFSLSIAYMAFFMIMASNFNTGESERMQYRLLLSLPIIRRTVINAKYAMISVWWLISYVTHIFIVILKEIFHLSLNLSFDVNVTLLSFCFAYLFASIFYPIHFKFGYRVSNLVGIIIFFLVASGFGKLMSINTGPTSIVLERPVLTVAILSFVVTLLSYLISERIFTKRDF